MKKHFNKNMIISEKEEEQFQPSNTCWICEKLIDDGDENVRDHCHVIGKLRGAAHWSCKNISKNVTTGDNDEKLDSHLSDENYLMYKNIWNEFYLKNMGDYHDHYLKKDVLLLADVFRKFINTCLKFYGLDHCHYFSSPGMSWDAMLKMTSVKLEKISDNDKYLFIEKGMRGGIFYIAKRYAKANNKYTNDYDPKKPSKFITYLDMNNLYG